MPTLKIAAYTTSEERWEAGKRCRVPRSPSLVRPSGIRVSKARTFYARLNANPVRASVLKATEAMLAATQPPAGVLPTLPMKPEDSIASLKSGPSTQRCCDQLHLSILNASEKSESILTREAQRPRVFQFGSH